MDLSGAIRQFVNQGRDLLRRLESEEGNAVSDVELHILRVELHLLEVKSSTMQFQRDFESKHRAWASDPKAQ